MVQTPCSTLGIRGVVSDERLRELERRWKETGSVEDEAAFLLERVRVGELTQERLELAAYCGHPASQAAVGEAGLRRQAAALRDVQPWLKQDASQFFGMCTGPVETEWKRRLADAEWIYGLGLWGKAVAVRASLLITAQLPLAAPAAREAVRAAEAWLESPDSSSTDLAQRQSETAMLESSRCGESQTELLCAHYAALAAAKEEVERVVAAANRCAYLAATRALSPERVTKAIKDGLVNWSLGSSTKA